MFSDFIKLFFPEICSGCGTILSKTENGICSSCMIELKQFNNSFKKKYIGRIKIECEIYAFEFVKDQLLQQILHKIKFKKHKNAAYSLGLELGKIISLNNNDIDAIVPVPSSIKKKEKRGYNHCDTIAIGVQEVLNKPILQDYLYRKNNMYSQKKSDRFQRWKNTENQFRLTGEFNEDIHVLLLDDVVTSGATIHGCAKLIEKKIKKISVAALARTKYKQN